MASFVPNRLMLIDFLIQPALY
uniref:Uncharacterized protein n=1 Tax=Arundo donax TaxID=35708 RepID=A0A0A9F8L9_ARUDO